MARQVYNCANLKIETAVIPLDLNQILHNICTFKRNRTNLSLVYKEPCWLETLLTFAHTNNDISNTSSFNDYDIFTIKCYFNCNIWNQSFSLPNVLILGKQLHASFEEHPMTETYTYHTHLYIKRYCMCIAWLFVAIVAFWWLLSMLLLFLFSGVPNCL